MGSYEYPLVFFLANMTPEMYRIRTLLLDSGYQVFYNEGARYTSDYKSEIFITNYYIKNVIMVFVGLQVDHEEIYSDFVTLNDPLTMHERDCVVPSILQVCDMLAIDPSRDDYLVGGYSQNGYEFLEKCGASEDEKVQISELSRVCSGISVQEYWQTIAAIANYSVVENFGIVHLPNDNVYFALIQMRDFSCVSPNIIVIGKSGFCLVVASDIHCKQLEKKFSGVEISSEGRGLWTGKVCKQKFLAYIKETV